MSYRPDPESLAAHACPAWWQDAKLGVMVTWGLYSVPAFAPAGTDVVTLLSAHPDDALARTPYAEWYENSLKFEEGPTAAQHRARFGDRPYADFRREFEAGLADWSPEPLLDVIEGAGARYVVPVLKHHDGYCLWPTAQGNPLRGAGWHAPREIAGELARATRARGLAFGAYYSAGLDWTITPQRIANLGEMRASLPTSAVGRRLMRAHWDELVERLDPDILWNDIGYPDAEDLWDLLAGYYNRRPDGVVNDRFQLPGESHAAMADPAARAAFNRAVADALKTPGFAFVPDTPPVFDHRTPEYAVGASIEGPWETVRGVGHSFGHNAAEGPADHLDGEALIALFLRVVGAGGNLLINIGPRADGSVPDLQARPLAALGAFLRGAGAAIFGTRPDQVLPRATVGEATLFPVARGRERFALVAGTVAEGEVRLAGWGTVRRVAAHGGAPIASRTEGADLLLAGPLPRVLELEIA
jgi:alpha-L-fucosidase